MIIRVKEPTIVGILTFVSMINVVLGWVERGRFYNLRLCFGQQKYSLPKIKTIIGHPKTSPKQIPMFFARPSEKERVFTCVVGAQKNSLGETFYLSDQNICLARLQYHDDV